MNGAEATLANLKEVGTVADLLNALRSNGGAQQAAGNAAFGAGDYEAAAASYSRAVELSDPFAEGTAALFSNRAACYTKLGRFAAALADADAAVAVRPGWAKAHFRRGAALFGLRRFAEAAAAHAAGLALAPGDEALLQGHALALATLREAAAAEPPLERALALLAAATPTRLLPVLVLSGFLGAGKTTLLQRVLRNAEGLRVAVVVNDLAALNVDAATLAAPALGSLTHAPDALVPLSNGCVCCTLRDELLTEEIGRAHV